MTPREAILDRIRLGLPYSVPVSQSPLPNHPVEEDPQVLIEEFASELDSLQGKFLRVMRSETVDTVSNLLDERQAKHLLTWEGNQLPTPGLIETLKNRGYRCIPAEIPLNRYRRRNHLNNLSQAEVGITSACGVISRIGALVMAGGKGQGRLASLLPPVHIALVTPDQFYPTLEVWLAAQNALALFEDSSSLTLIAGPSRTSDIERVITLGAHGPRELIVICLD